MDPSRRVPGGLQSSRVGDAHILLSPAYGKVLEVCISPNGAILVSTGKRNLVPKSIFGATRPIQRDKVASAYAGTADKRGYDGIVNPLVRNVGQRSYAAFAAKVNFG